ncbi:unnamed protein product [Owenia fusiformis]|uniref:CCHC-type domain-containing protein n=1 Tax=Owenia fusiformis TaxID=6347 RepID=A0A8S4PDK1_OWEFU|nr:unnamed protein product [Owenia fusiformis]
MISRSLTVWCSHRDTNWAKEDAILDAMQDVVEEIDIEAIQIANRNVVITLANRPAKIAAITMGLNMNNKFIALRDIEKSTVNITLRDIPIEVPNTAIHAYISGFADNVEDIQHGYITRHDGTKSTIKSGIRYISVSKIVRPIPNNPVIVGFPGRCTYRGQPCSFCESTDHPWYRCSERPPKQIRKCFICQSENHISRDCTVTQSERLERETNKESPDHIRFDEVSIIQENNNATENQPTETLTAESDSVQPTMAVVGASLAKAMVFKEKVEKRAVSGTKIDGVKDILKDDPITSDNIVIQIGTNDIVYSYETPETSVRRYDTLVKDIKDENPNSKIFVCSLPPVHPYKNDNMNRSISKMNMLLSKMCNQHDDVYYVDHTPVLLCHNGKTTHRDYNSSDPKGVHLSAAGYTKLVKNITSDVKKINGELTFKTPVNKRKERATSSTPSSSEKQPKTGKYS